MCAAPEFNAGLYVRVLCAESRKKDGASQGPVVMLLEKAVGEMAPL